MVFSKELVISISTGSVLIYLLSKVIEIYSKRRKYKHIPGPPADGFLGFFFGNLNDLIYFTKKGVMYTDIINEW